MKPAVTAELKSAKSKAEVSAKRPDFVASAPTMEVARGAPAGLPMFLGIRLQPKLTVNSPGDIYEQEADRVAEQVMGMPESERAASPAPATAGVQRKCDCGGICSQCQGRDDEERVQMKAAMPGGAAQASAPPIVHQVLNSPGQPLDPATRSLMATRFGHDFGQVRVHTDETAAESARAVGAKAYTVNHDLVFGAGEFSPESQAGRRLLGHELTHVVQQSKSASPAARTVQRSPQDIADLYQPAFDSDEQRRYGMAPLTAAAEMSPLAMARKGQRPVTATAALKDFVERFPFLQPLAVSYRAVVEEVLGKDVADFKAVRSVDTQLNRDYLALAPYAGSLPEGVTRLIELGKVESLAANQARTENIWKGWILSEAAVDVPSSPLAESDGRTYLRGKWEKVRQSPVFLVLDGWASPAIRLYISDRTNDWEIRHSGKLLQMDDLLGIGSIRQTYDEQEKDGPKRSALRNSLREVEGGLKGARFLFQDQLKINRQAAPGVVGISEYLGEGGAGFDSLVDEYKAWATAPDGPAKGAAFSELLDRYEIIAKSLGGAGDAFSDLAKQYEQQVYGEIWEKEYQLTQRPEIQLTAEEKKQVHTEGWARALKDWVQAPDVLPEEAQFTRVEQAAARASQYLEQGDLQSAAVYLAVALEVEQRIAARIDRYKTRVTSGAGSAVDTLSHIKTGSQIFLAVAGGAEFGLVGGAAVDASFTFATSVASGESVGTALGQAGKAFLTDMVFGRISSAMSAQLLSRGWSPFFAHALAGVAAVPYVKAAEIMYQKALDPDSPMPDLTKLPEEAFESSVFGMLITAAHEFGGMGVKPYDPAAMGEGGIESKATTLPQDPVRLREQAKRQAQAEKQLVKESALGSITLAEKNTLESSVSKSGNDLSPNQALTEREIAHRNVGEPINEPPFRIKYKVPNGHDIKETPQGDMFERCSVECGIYNSKGELIGKRQVTIPAPQRPFPPRGVPPEQMPVVAEFPRNRATDRGRFYYISGDEAQFRASQESGHHVYEYFDANGELLYVGKSGGEAEPDANWIDRLRSDHSKKDWIADAVRVRVFYNLTPQEMWAFEEVEIGRSRHNKKPGEYSGKFGDAGLSDNANSAGKRPNALFAIYGAPVR